MNAPSPLASPFLNEEIQRPALEQVMAEPKAAPLPPTAALPKIRVVDVGGRPLANFRFTLLQGRTTLAGTLDGNGETAGLGSAALPFDRGQPFRLHVAGMVCTIARGAMLVVDDPEVEYGGSFFDWTLAADADARVREAFWREYDEVRQSADGIGALHFLQHDHVVRRPLRLTATLAVFEARLPAVRLGPIVRYTDDHQALVWLELKTPALVRVVYGKAPNPARPPRPGEAPAATTARHACSVRVGGRHFALVALEGLEADSVVQYRIELGAQPPAGALPQHEADFSDAVFPRAVRPDTALEAQAYEGKPWFFLRTLPRRSDSLRFAHGSCRKWPGDSGPRGEAPGPDMLEAFGEHWLAQLKDWSNWPRFFVHTGDQIYADDIGRSLATTLIRQRRAAALPGPAPQAAQDVAFGAWAGRFGWRYAKASPPPDRDLAELQKLRPRVGGPGQEEHDIEGAIARARKAQEQQAGFEAALKDMPARPMGSKLQVLNRLLWELPVSEAEVPRVDKARGLVAAQDYRVAGPPARQFRIGHPAAGETLAVHAADFAEYAACYEQAWSTPHARRALAHVPSYMIFDDHEVTDDWNADREWLAVLHSARDPLSMWPMTVTDALAAYWVYQGWGNLSPQAAAADERGQLLAEARRSGRDALPALRRLIHRKAVLPMAPKERHDTRLAWHFAVPTGGTPFLVVDLRTDREVHGDGRISKSRWAWIERELAATRSAAAFIVLPVPFLMPDPMLFAFRHPGFTGRLAGAKSTLEFRRDSDLEHPAGNPVWDQIKGLLEKLQKTATTLKTIVIVSGDIHFSVDLDGQLPRSKKGPRLLQLVSSGLRQTISDSKQSKMASAYRGWLNTIGGSEGVDTHRGIVMTLAGLEGPGGRRDNFVYPTSFAVVQMKTVPFGPAGATVPVPLVEQQHYVAGGNGVVPWTLRHMTQGDGSALMSLHDPGMKHPARPTAYPKAAGGIGVAREAEDLLDEAPAGESLFEADPAGADESVVLEVVDESPLPFDECLAEEGEAGTAGAAPEPEQEVFDHDDRRRIQDTLTLPARWVCAIDLFVDDPKQGRGAPPVQSLSRATGILIGPRHVLTAAHVFDDATMVVDGQVRTLPVTQVRVSPARNGDNGSHPLGSETSRTFFRRARWAMNTDYALIVLDRDLSKATHRSIKGPLGYWGQSAAAPLRALDLAALGAVAVGVIGYPGDRNGDKPIEHDEAKIRYNAQNRMLRDSWASTAWQSSGTARAHDRIAGLVTHDADTWEGQSGGPVILDRKGVLDLLAVHGGAFPSASAPTSNRAAQVSAQMLADLRDWINQAARATWAEVRNDTLVFNGPAPAREAEAGIESETESEPEADFEQDTEGGPEGESETASLPDPAQLAARIDAGLRAGEAALPQVASAGRRGLLQFAISFLRTHFFPDGWGLVDAAGRQAKASSRALIQATLQGDDGVPWPLIHRVRLLISARPPASGRWAGEHAGSSYSVITLFAREFGAVSEAAAAGAAVHEVVHLLFALVERVRRLHGEAVAERFLAGEPWHPLDMRPFAREREAMLGPLAEMVKLLALPVPAPRLADALVKEAFAYTMGDLMQRAVDDAAAAGRKGPRVAIDSVSLATRLVRAYIVETSALPASALDTAAVRDVLKRLAPAVDRLGEAIRGGTAAPTREALLAEPA